MGYSIKMGVKAKDIITGFEGVITARCSYITGCDQCLLQPLVDEKGAHQSAHWFDENRIEALSADPIVLGDPVSATAKKGGPQPTPPSY